MDMGRSFLVVTCFTLTLYSRRWVFNKAEKDDEEDSQENSTTVIENTTIQHSRTICPVAHTVAAPVPAVQAKIAEELKRSYDANKASAVMRAANEDYRTSVCRLRVENAELRHIAARREEFMNAQREKLCAEKYELIALFEKEEKYRACIETCAAKIQDLDPMLTYYEQSMKEIKELTHEAQVTLPPVKYKYKE